MSRGVFRTPPPSFIGGTQPYAPPIKLPPSVLAVPEDNPPFGLRNTLFTLIQQWQPFNSLIFPQRKLVFETLAETIPFNNYQLGNIVNQWVPFTFSNVQQRKLIFDVPVETAPFNSYQLSTILSAWVPPAPIRQRRELIIQGEQVNDPPFGIPSVSNNIIYRAWQPPLKYLTYATPFTPIPPVIIDNPPPYSGKQLFNILRTWDRKYEQFISRSWRTETGPLPIIPPVPVLKADVLLYLRRYLNDVTISLDYTPLTLAATVSIDNSVGGAWEISKADVLTYLRRFLNDI